MTSSQADVRVFADLSHLAQAVATALEERIVAAGSNPVPFHLVMTGGSTGEALAQALTERVAQHGMPLNELEHLHVWWGDERFLPAGHADRNDSGDTDVMLRTAPVPLTQVHRVEGPIAEADVHTAARWYAESLEAWAPLREDGTRFDVVLCGIGPDGHVASLFPGRDHDREGQVTFGVEDSPKPPAQRVTMSLPTLRASRAVWFMAAGGEKAHAVDEALSAGTEDAGPAAGLRGTQETVFWLERDAASAHVSSEEKPSSSRRPSSIRSRRSLRVVTSE